ncbi:13798_t:CDS:2, partial [Ambispora leptoticha]
MSKLRPKEDNCELEHDINKHSQNFENHMTAPSGRRYGDMGIK